MPRRAARDDRPKARERLVSKFDLEATQPEWALGYTFDISLRGPNTTPLDTDDD